MNRRLIAAGLVALAAVASLAVIWTHTSAEAATPFPSSSCIWMSTVSVDRQGSRYDIQAGTFLVDQDGQVRVRASSDAAGRGWADWVYDPATQTFTQASDSGGSVRYVRRTGMSPDMGMRMSVVSPFEYSYSAAAIVRAAVAEHDPALSVKDTTCIGRPAWEASYTKGGWRHTATVDKATGFPLRYILADIDHPRTYRSVWRVIDMATDVPLDASSFSIAIPNGATVDSASSGHEHFTTADKLAAQVGYQPLVPATLPEGSILAASSTQPDPWGPYMWFFPAPVPAVDLSKLPDNEVNLYYHRGYDWFTVTERLRTGGFGNSVPLALDKQPGFAYRKTVLECGAFAGKTARTWMRDGAILYVQNATHAVAISGDLRRSELLSIAASLQQ